MHTCITKRVNYLHTTDDWEETAAPIRTTMFEHDAPELESGPEDGSDTEEDEDANEVLSQRRSLRPAAGRSVRLASIFC